MGPPLSPPAPRSRPRSELIQLVAVTQKTAERSYREHIEQQIQTYQRRWGAPHLDLHTHHSRFLPRAWGRWAGSVVGNCCPVDPNPLLFNHICWGWEAPSHLLLLGREGALCQSVQG